MQHSLTASVEVMAKIDDRWLSVDEICKYLGISKDTVYKWMERFKEKTATETIHIHPRANNKTWVVKHAVG